MASRRSFLAGAGASLAPSGLALSAAATKLPNITLDPAAAKKTIEPFGELLIYFEGATDQVRSMTAGSLRLKAGMSPHPPHTHAEEEFMVITEGSGEITVDGKVQKVGPGSMMYCAANKPHGIVNTGKSPLLFYFYKWKV